MAFAYVVDICEHFQQKRLVVHLTHPARSRLVFQRSIHFQYSPLERLVFSVDEYLLEYRGITSVHLDSLYSSSLIFIFKDLQLIAV